MVHVIQKMSRVGVDVVGGHVSDASSQNQKALSENLRLSLCSLSSKYKVVPFTRHGQNFEFFNSRRICPTSIIPVLNYNAHALVLVNRICVVLEYWYTYQSNVSAWLWVNSCGVRDGEKLTQPMKKGRFPFGAHCSNHKFATEPSRPQFLFHIPRLQPLARFRAIH